MACSTWLLTPMSLSARLIALRKERGMSQQALADAIKIHVNQIKRYEAGSAHPSVEVLKRIAKTFSVSADYLLFEKGERDPDEDLRLQFEAIKQFRPEEKRVTQAVLEGLILKHTAQRFTKAARG